MIGSIPPGTPLIVGAFLMLVLRGRWQKVGLLLLPIVSALHMLVWAPTGTVVTWELSDFQLTLIRADKLSLLWGYVFHIAAFLCVLYALHVKDVVQHLAALIYAGSAIAAVFAGDLITLFVFWELTAVSSVFLIWATGTKRSYRAGMRYLIIQVGSGVLLLAGTILHYQQSGSLQFGGLGEVGVFGLGTLGKNLIFVAFGIKAAFPLLHNWLQDSYPEATPTGTVFLSAFTTKLAIYALARGFAGTECLIWIGATMTAFPIFFAVIENDLRRVLSYSLNNQLGYMIVGIGIGTPLALNGTAAHAFAHILYKALLFMSMGAVLYRTGTIKASELGGLYKSMPWTAGFCMIGSASISGFPLFSGFVSKSMIMTAAAAEHHTIVFLVLLFASAGVVDHSGIKIPFFAFFAHDSGKRVDEAPLNMFLAMGISAFLCVALGLAYPLLYAILPYNTNYLPYTTTHVVTQMQLLMWAALGFTVLMRTGVYPPEVRSVNLDTDWIYRRLLPDVIKEVGRVGGSVDQGVRGGVMSSLNRGLSWLGRQCGPEGLVGRTWTTSGMAVWAAILLALYLLAYYG